MNIIFNFYLFSFLLTGGYCYYKDCIEETNENKKTINYNKYKESITLVLFNIVFTGYFGLKLLIWLFNYEPRNFNLLLSIRDYFICVFMASVFFYFVHKAFHINKTLYKFHIVHHKFKYPIGLRAAYTHPIDYLFGNIVPFGMTPFFLNTDVLTMCLITFSTVYSTVINEHSDYNNCNHHLDHHKYFNCNYGSDWMDAYFGTLRIPKKTTSCAKINTNLKNNV